MKGARQYLPPRQQVIYAHTRRMLDATGSNYTTFAMDVAERYLAMTAPDVRQVKLRVGEGAELIKAMENNGQVVRRYMDGTLKTLPADLEDAWVMSLPAPFRDACERELARRRGMLAVHLPHDDGLQMSSVSSLFKDYGELVQALAPVLADGKFGPDDKPHAQKVYDTGDAVVISAVIALRREMSRGINVGGVE